jgi:hypothetical protein
VGCPVLSWDAGACARQADTRAPASAGQIDREALGSLAFSDRQARRKLNAATHPAVLLEIVRQLLLHWLACRWLVVRLRTATLCLLPQRRSEPGCASRRWTCRCCSRWARTGCCARVSSWPAAPRPRCALQAQADPAHAQPRRKVATIWPCRCAQLERLLQRDRCSRELAEAKVAAQMPLEHKAALAVHVIDNSGDLAALEPQARARAVRRAQTAPTTAAWLTCPSAPHRSGLWRTT